MADDLQQAIAAGELRPGERIDSEPELAVAYSVSRETVRRALDVLEREGLIRRVRGSGTYVTGPTSRHFSLATFADDMTRLGRTPSARLLEATRHPADRKEASKLAIREGTECFFIRRLLLADGEPVAVETRVLPVAFCPGLLDEDLEQPSLHWLLTVVFGIPLVKVDHTVEIGEVGVEAAPELEAEPADSAYRIDRLTYTTGPGGPVPAVWYRSIHRGDAYAIEFRKDAS
jgi:GntR family transcriptional regulator